MTCSHVQSLLQLYIDHQLSLPRIRALERHLTHCAACRAEWMLLEDIIAGVHSLSNVVEPPWLTEAIMARIAATTAQSPEGLPNEIYQRTQAMCPPAAFRPTMSDLILSSMLATIVVLCFILLQPALRTGLVNSVNPLVAVLLNGLQLLVSPDIGIIGWLAWMLWLLLGICITFLLAGREARSLWRQRIRNWLPQDWR